MKNFADLALVQGLLARFEGQVNSETWPDIENEIIGEISEILGFNWEKSREIFQNGVNAILTNSR